MHKHLLNYFIFIKETLLVHHNAQIEDQIYEIVETIKQAEYELEIKSIQYQKSLTNKENNKTTLINTLLSDFNWHLVDILDAIRDFYHIIQKLSHITKSNVSKYHLPQNSISKKQVTLSTILLTYLDIFKKLNISYNNKLFSTSEITSMIKAVEKINKVTNNKKVSDEMHMTYHNLLHMLVTIIGSLKEVLQLIIIISQNHKALATRTRNLSG